MRILIAILLVLLTSCSGLKRGVKVTATGEDKEQIERAITKLNNPNVELNLAFNYIVIYRVPDESLSNNVLAVAYVGGPVCKIAITDKAFRSEGLLTSVVWHEIGHCYGIHHNDNPYDIMYPSVREIEKYSTFMLNLFLRRLHEATH